MSPNIIGILCILIINIIWGIITVVEFINQQPLSLGYVLLTIVNNFGSIWLGTTAPQSSLTKQRMV